MQENNNRVWALNNAGMGDVVALLCYVLNFSEKNGTIEKVYAGPRIKGDAHNEENGWYTKRAKDILSLFNTSGRVEIVYDLPEGHEEYYVKWNERYTADYYPTKRVWTPNRNKIISCNLWGGDGGGRCKKVSIQEKDLFEETLTGQGYEVCWLGKLRGQKEQSVEECVEILSKSEFYVGVDTGPTHLALCVGTPIHLIRNCRSIINIVSSYRHKTEKMSIYKSLKHFLKIYDGDDRLDDGLYGPEERIRRRSSKHSGMGIVDDNEYNNAHLAQEIEWMMDCDGPDIFVNPVRSKLRAHIAKYSG